MEYLLNTALRVRATGSLASTISVVGSIISMKSSDRPVPDLCTLATKYQTCPGSSDAEATVDSPFIVCSIYQLGHVWLCDREGGRVGKEGDGKKGGERLANEGRE